MKLKSLIYIVIMILFIPALFGVAEISFRIAGLGYDTSVLVQIPGTQLVTQSQEIMAKYFNTKRASSSVNNQRNYFDLSKKNTLKIVVLGESTPQGFPYMANWDFGQILGLSLKSTKLWDDVEVMNLGFSAQTSYTALDLLGKLSQYKPDLVLFYGGHNEIYGTVSYTTGRSPFFNRLNLLLKESRVFQVLFQSLTPEDQGESNLMARQFANKTIPASEEVNRELEVGFIENIKSMIQWSTDHNVPMLFIEPISNLIDQPPFVGAADGKYADVLKSMNEAIQKSNLVELQTTVENYRDVEDFNLNANVMYLTGQLARNFNNKLILDYFIMAKDLDIVPFRARTPLLLNLAKTVTDARSAGAPVQFVPLNTDLYQSYGPGIFGFDIFLDHLHFNWFGNFLVARHLLPASTKLLDLSSEQISVAKNFFDTPDVWGKDLPFTPLFAEQALIRVISLSDDPPFSTMLLPIDWEKVNFYPPKIVPDLKVRDILLDAKPEEGDFLLTSLNKVYQLYLTQGFWPQAYELLRSFQFANPITVASYVNLAQFWGLTKTPDKSHPYWAAAWMLSNGDDKVLEQNLNQFLETKYPDQVVAVKENILTLSQKFGRGEESILWQSIPHWSDLEITF